MSTKVQSLHFVFDGPPGPDGGRFVECETTDGHSVNAGEWHERADGLWELRVALPSSDDLIEALKPFAHYWQWMMALNDPEWIKLAHRDEYFTQPLTVAHFRRAAAAIAKASPALTGRVG
jgi:hypothetical protein